jgi:Predicted 3'-5' exonuclease related to the exonuclease domain of PolB
MTETIQRIVLASRPVGEPTLDNFRLEDVLSSFAPQAKTTLHELCRIMGMPGKPEGIHGGEVARYFLEAGSRKSRIIAGPTSLTGIGFGCATNCFVENSRRSSFNLASRSLESSSFSMIRFTNPLVRVAQRLKSPMSALGQKRTRSRA